MRYSEDVIGVTNVEYMPFRDEKRPRVFNADIKEAK
jgi:hypothetical protein